MLSIITAIYNQLDVNKLYYEYLKKYTKGEFELIIIDNNSTDGSREFFQENKVKVICNDDNYPYPYCQNQGINAASGDWFAFLNNDLLVSKDWDVRAKQILEDNNLDVAFCSTNEKVENKKNTTRINQRWKFIRKPMVAIFGSKIWNLRFMHKLMYGNWVKFTDNRYNQFQNQYIEDISGSAVLLTKKGLNVLGEFDERIQAGDFDLFLRAKQRSINKGDIKPAKVILGVFVHHYVRLTSKGFYPPFVTKENMIRIQDKWGKEYANKLLENADRKIK